MLGCHTPDGVHWLTDEPFLKPKSEVIPGSICSGKVEGRVACHHGYWGGRGTDLELW